MDMESVSEKVGDAKPVDGSEPPAGQDAPVRTEPVDAAAPVGGTRARRRFTSKRLKLTLPNAGPGHPWWVRHAPLLSIFEWAVAVLLFAVAFYYLWLIFFASPGGDQAPDTPPPTVEEFRAVSRALPAIGPSAAWKPAKPSDRWRRVIIHHSATAQGSAESFDRVHREERKWENGLGYHFVIGNGKGMGDGEVAVGKRWKEQLDGAHIRGTEGGENLNSSSIGIALVGNFEHSLPTARQMAALKGLVNYLRRECSISLASVVGHAELSGKKTLCPGQYFFVDELRLAIANP